MVDSLRSTAKPAGQQPVQSVDKATAPERARLWAL